MEILRCSFFLLMLTASVLAGDPDARGLEMLKDRTDDGPRHRLVHRASTRSFPIFESTEALEAHFRAMGPLPDDAECVLVREVLGGSSGDERWSLIAWKTADGRILDVWRRVLDENTVLEPAASTKGRELVTLKRRARKGQLAETQRIGFVEGSFRKLDQAP